MISYLGVIRTIMIADTSQFQRGMASASAGMRASAVKMRRDAQSLVGIGAALNVGITMPVLMATRAIVKYGADYETIMMKMRHVSGLTIKQFKLLEKEQDRISRQVGVDPRALGKVGYLGAQAQLKGIGALSTFQRTVAMAMKTMPGEAKPEDVAEGFLSIIKSFNIEESKFSQTMAQMIKTIDLGRISWQEYNNTIQQVVALSSALGGEDALRNLNLSIAAATLGGVRGPQAATAIRNLYRRIYTEGVKPDSAMNMAAGMFGFRDDRGRGSVVKMFEEGAGADLTKFSQMITMAGALANPKYASSLKVMAREYTTFLKLANSAPAEMARFRREYKDAGPEIYKRYLEAQMLVSNQLEAVGAAWGRLKKSFFDAKAAEALRNIFQSIINFFDKIAALPNAVKSLITFTAGLASFASIITLIAGIIQSMGLTWKLNKLIGDPKNTAATVKRALSVTGRTCATTSIRTPVVNVRATNCIVTGGNVADGHIARGTARSVSDRIKGVKVGNAKANAALWMAMQEARRAAGNQTANAPISEALYNAGNTVTWIPRRGAKLLTGSGGKVNFTRPLGKFGPATGYAIGSAYYDAAGRWSTRPDYKFSLPNYRGATPTGVQVYQPPYTGTTAVVPKGVGTMAARSGGTTALARMGESARNVTGDVIVGGPAYAASAAAGAAKGATAAAASGYGAKIATAAKGAGLFIGKLYLFQAVMRSLGELLSITILPALESMGISLKSVGKVLSFIDKWIVRSLSILFVTISGTIQNIFGTIIGTIMGMVERADYLFTLLRTGLEGLISWIRNSWLGRQLGWAQSQAERDRAAAERAAILEKQRSDVAGWQQHIGEQAKGIIGLGPSSAVVAGMERLAQRWDGVNPDIGIKGTRLNSGFLNYAKQQKGQQALTKAMDRFNTEFNPISALFPEGAFNRLLGIDLLTPYGKQNREQEAALADTFAYREYGTSEQYAAMISSQNSIKEILDNIRKDERERLAMERKAKRDEEEYRKKQSEFMDNWGVNPGDDLAAMRTSLETLAGDME